MAIQKKYGKGRLDHYYRLAKEKGYRARAAFKLIQLNKKYNFLEKSKVLLDLCAAPGSWCQVAAEVMPVESLIIGVDLAPIKPIPRVISFQSDITTPECRSTIRRHLKTWKADTVLHDGAPNVGASWVHDAYSQAELVLEALRLATDFLVRGGTFVTKIFRSKDYNSLMWVFNQLFTKVEATKPPSSRNVSAEIFVVCRDYKAPKHIDPKFLDPQAVFAELPDGAPNNEAKVFNPEKKKRKREGYEEGDYTQYKEAPVSEFIQTSDPIAILGSMNALSFEQSPNGDVALAALERLPETTAEIRDCCADLKVLGRKDFRNLLRWRLKVRERFGFSSKKSERIEDANGEAAVEIEPMDEELRIQEELQNLNEKEMARRRKERRKENEVKRKEIVRMQMHMTTPTEIGMEQGGIGADDAIFSIKSTEESDLARKAGNKMAIIKEKPSNEGPGSEIDEDEEEDEAEDALERELDSMYVRYQEHRAEVDAKYRVKKLRTQAEGEDSDWEGFSAEEASSEEENIEFDSSDEDEDEDEESGNDAPAKSGAKSRADAFFKQALFQDVGGLDDVVEDEDESDVDDTTIEKSTKKTQTSGKQKDKLQNGSVKAKLAESDDKPEKDSFEVVRNATDGNGSTELRQDDQTNIDIITAEAMTLAHELATGRKTTHDLIDDGFNKLAFRDQDGLPDWFVEDENKHSKPHRPITAEAAAAIKEKLRALNARPIKKVQEAKARKKFKAAQKLEKLRKKSAMLADEESMSERDKAQTIAKMMAKAAKRKPKQHVKLVVARGDNRGISGRPKGVKGKYKIVDARMKKEVRAQKRREKRKH